MFLAILLVIVALVLAIRHPFIGVTVLSVGLLVLGGRELLEPSGEGNRGAVFYVVSGVGLALFSLPRYLRSRKLTPQTPASVEALHPEVEPQLGELEALRAEEAAERARQAK
jgi:hypothetical protein